MWENAEQNNSEYGKFSRSEIGSQIWKSKKQVQFCNPKAFTQKRETYRNSRNLMIFMYNVLIKENYSRNKKTRKKEN